MDTGVFSLTQASYLHVQVRIHVHHLGHARQHWTTSFTCQWTANIFLPIAVLPSSITEQSNSKHVPFSLPGGCHRCLCISSSGGWREDQSRRSHQLRYTPPFPWAIYDGSRSASQCTPCQPDFFGLVILALVCPSPMVTSTARRRRASKVSRLHDRHGKVWFSVLTVYTRSFRSRKYFHCWCQTPPSEVLTVHPGFHWYSTFLSRTTWKCDVFCWIFVPGKPELA